ncbi:hypothetical protein N7E81_10370 [Reichenbachiella carrageenanivorans]|uniref:YhhN-like protein n=1 Tax=Reichenbachiella carrageenanivorans TaxID=2979869 RepID=A0ABY6CV41_9BACT|nr:hypothetical protein [Reichenbachiella carrageenanivorans]UXX77774.1 hypothetical protein N7E81_10370 [Reichenbachiella carrageenanivorans]
MEMEKWVVYGSMFSVLLPLIIGSSTLMNKPDKGVLPILLLLLLSFLTDLICYFYAPYGPTYWIINLFSIFEILILGFIYSTQWKSRFIFLIVPIIWCVAFGIKLFENINGFHGEYFAISSFIVMAFACYAFYRIFIEESVLSLESYYFFWINTGFLIYASGSLFSFLLSHHILMENESSWMLHNAANILKNLLFAIGLWKARLTR